MAGPLPTVSEQIRNGQAYYRQQRGAIRFIAYFQTFTNTYSSVAKLKALYDEALCQEDVIGLSIGTRPDCVSDEILDLIASYAPAHHIWLELGIQSIHDRTLALINRGHHADDFLDAVQRTAHRNLLVCAHIIVGLPGETRGDVLETARVLAGLPVHGIKIHSLLVLEGTALAEAYREGRIHMLSRGEYVETVCDILELLPPEMVIQRLTAEGYQDIFLGPDWARGKMAVLNAIEQELDRRDSYQGCRYHSAGEQGR